MDPGRPKVAQNGPEKAKIGPKWAEMVQNGRTSSILGGKVYFFRGFFYHFLEFFFLSKVDPGSPPLPGGLKIPKIGRISGPVGSWAPKLTPGNRGSPGGYFSGTSLSCNSQPVSAIFKKRDFWTPKSAFLKDFKPKIAKNGRIWG